MKNNTPRRKRLNKTARLSQAENWMKSFGGKNLVKGYAKWFGVDWLTALRELKLTGVQFTEEAEQRVIRGYQHRIPDKRKRKQRSVPNEFPLYDSDERFAFIAGYTSKGVPFGMTHEELENQDTEYDFLVAWKGLAPSDE
jgi:hypothetical protein